MEPAKTISQQELLEQMQLESTRSWSFNWSFSWLRSLFGAALVLVGAVLIFYILRELYLAYYLMEGNVLINTIINWLADQPLLHEIQDIPALVIGRGLAVMVALVAFFLFAMLCVPTACKFIGAGMNLLTRPAR